MPNPATTRAQRLRKTKAQLIDEIDTLEQRAAEAQALLTDAIESISEGFVLYDADGRLVLCNSTYKDFYDYTDAEVAPGVHFEDLVRLDIEKGTVKSLGDGEEDHFRARVAERGSARGLFYLELSDGRWLNIRDRKTAAAGSVSTQTDVTDLKRAEEIIAEKEAQLRVALDHMPGGMFMVDEDLKLQVYNDQYKEMYGLPEHIVEGSSLIDAVRILAERGDYGPGDPAELVEQRMQGYIERMTLRHEERLPNGRVIELFRTPVEGGGVVGIATDITERKRDRKSVV